jgi:hypothetical protein
MFKIIRSKETSHTAAITGSKKINGDTLKNIRPEASRNFRNKEGNIRKAELISLQLKVRTITLETCI